MFENIKDEIQESIKLKERILKSDSFVKKIEFIAEKIMISYKNDGKLLIAGNGGSAADSQHIAAELVGQFFKADRRALNAIALSVDTSILTSIGNDRGFENIFSRQVEAYGSKNDVFLALTSSGNSKNLIKALKTCKDKNMYSIVLNGKDGGVIEKENLADFNFIIPSQSTPRIQEVHMLIYHIVCNIIEKSII